LTNNVNQQFEEKKKQNYSEEIAGGTMNLKEALKQ
jgi:hypothetical protein